MTVPAVVPQPGDPHADREQAVLDAARTWRIARHSELDGVTFHRACKALDEAVAALNGELNREPVPPPSPEALERGRQIVARARAYSDARRPKGHP